MQDKASQSSSDPGSLHADLPTRLRSATYCSKHRLCPWPFVWPELGIQGFGTSQRSRNFMVTADRGRMNQQASKEGQGPAGSVCGGTRKVAGCRADCSKAGLPKWPKGAKGRSSPEAQNTRPPGDKSNYCLESQRLPALSFLTHFLRRKFIRSCIYFFELDSVWKGHTSEILTKGF